MTPTDYTQPEDHERDMSKRDPLAIAIAVVGVFIQLGVAVYWGGKLESRVSAVERSIEKSEVRQQSIEKQDGAQDAQIAVNIAQYTEVLRRLGSIETKLDEKRR
jgi:hypothetical protein